MKYYPAVIALCLFFVVEESLAQDRSFELGVVIGEPTRFGIKLWTDPVNAFDLGSGCFALEGGFSERDHSCDVENYSQEQSNNLGDLSDRTESIESSKQLIFIDLKIPLPLFDIIGLDIDKKSNGYLLQIHCTKRLLDFESWLKPIGDNTWLYITVADAKADVAVLQNFKPTTFVKKILIFQSATSVQLTFMLNGQVNSTEIIPMEGNQDILVAVFTPMEE